MTGNRGHRIRPDVVALLADQKAGASDFSGRPWRLVHEDGRPFTPAENGLANTATPDEGRAAQRLLLAGMARQGEQFRTRTRLLELLGTDLRRGTEFSAAVAKLTPAERAEVARLLEVAEPDGPLPGSREDGT